ncbi:hypothetical protein, partial [Enterococcus faecium]|uniref:hypothetical protein n=1 Tax=Enterococcus faecium TaxID=1352 RepID=UPI003908039E
TLASAHYLWETRRADRQKPLTFHTLSGQLTASASGDGWIRLDFPVERITEADAPDRLADALGGVVPRFVGTNGLDLLIELDSECYYSPPYLGPSGWIAMRLDREEVDWDRVGD